MERKALNVAILYNGNSVDKPDRAELIKSLQDCGHTVFLGGAMTGYINDYYRETGTHFLPIIASRNNTNPIKEIASIFSVAKKIRQEKIIAVIIYGVKNHSAMTIGSWLGGAKRIICVVNGSGNLFRMPGMKGALVRFMAFPMLRIAYKHSMSICFQNCDDIAFFKKKGLIKDNDDIFVTGGSGVNLKAFPYAPMPKDIRFLFLSRITASKGLKEYCNAAKIVKEKYPDAVFDVVGPLDSTIESGAIKELLESSIDKGIVNYHGYTDQVAKWMQRCRFFIYPSYYPEGMPRCVLQALSTGRPVITCNSAGCKETVIDGVNGFLVPIKDNQILAEKMIWMIEHAKEVEQMAKSSRELAETKFDVNAINSKIINKLIG
jgi:glycosyltransferase involved in cell wall biosynthesis